MGVANRALVRVPELVRVERWLPGLRGGPGRPRLSRAALARAFLAKAVFDLPTTRTLRERLQVDATLRRLCGRERIDGIPSEATFSRAFAECAESDLPTRLHEALVRAHLEGHVVGHIARDSTAIPVRERRQRKADQEPERAAQAARMRTGRAGRSLPSQRRGSRQTEERAGRGESGRGWRTCRGSATRVRRRMRRATRWRGTGTSATRT